MGREYNEARKRANRKWDEANKDRYARISLMLPAEVKPQIKAAAEATGQSVNAWILDAIKQHL